MSKIIGAQIIGNSVYIIKKRGITDFIKDIFTGGYVSSHSHIDIEKPDNKHLKEVFRKRALCHIHRARH